MKKKIIAMVLAVVTLVSSLGALSAAFAAESTELDAIRQQIDSATNLTDADGKALALRFKLLSDDEKDSLGVDAVQKMYTLAYEAAPGDDKVKVDVEKKIAFQKEMLGEYTKEMQAGYKLRRILYANNQFRESYDFITVDVDGTSVTGVIDNAFDYVNDTSNANSNWQYLYTAKAQNKILDETIKKYKESSELAREYADIFQHLNVQGQLVDGVVKGYQGYGRNSFLREVVKQFNNTKMPKSFNKFFEEAGVDPNAPVKPTAPNYPADFGQELDSTYDTFMADPANVAWTQILAFIGTWFESAITPEMLAAAGCKDLADAKTKAPAKKIEIAAAENAHKDWIAKSETTKKYEQDLKDYQPKKELFDKTSSDYEKYKSDERVKYLKNMDCFTKSEMKAFEAAFEITDVYNEFFADQNNKEKEQKAIDAYQKLYVDGLNNFEKKVLTSNSMEKILYIGGQNKSLKDAMETVRKIRDVSAYTEFRKWVDEHEIPATKSFEYNKTITDAKNRLKSIDGSFTGGFETNYPETYAKYQKILDMWKYYYPTDKPGAIHQDTFAGETVTLKSDRNLAYLVELLLPNANGLLSVALGSIAGNPTAEKSQYKGIFNNDNVTFLVKTVYQLLASIKIEGLGLSLSIPPSGMGSVSEIIIDRYPQAGEALAKAANWADVGKVDWGITSDNDYDAFANAFIVALEPIISLLTVVQVSFPNSSTYAQYDTNTATKDFKFGAYEQVIIPILEALGVKDIMTSDAFTAVALSGAGLAAQVKMVVDQFKPVIQELLANPVQYLASILPNLMYHLQDGCALGGIGGLLSGIGVSLDLGWDTIVGMLDGALAGTGLTVADLQLDKLAKLGKATEVKSSRANTQTVRFIEADTASVYNHLANVIDEVVTKLGIDLGVNSELVKVEAPAYPHDGKMTKDVVLALVDGIDALVSDMLDINGLINDNLCTNAMVAQIVEGLYGALGDTNMDILKLNINVTPEALSEALGSDKKFKDLAGELNGHTSWKDVSLYLTNDDGEVVHETSMGFKDGDREGFFDTLVAVLRPLVKVLADTNVLTNTERADGTTAYGLYDLVIVPVLEDLGMTPNSSETYTKNFNQLMKKAKDSQGKVDADKAGEAYDYLINTIINPIVKILDSIGSTPVKTLMSILPNVAYQAQHGKIFGLISNIPGLSKDGKLDIAGLVNGLLADAEIAIELPELNLDMVASNGQMTEKKSISSIRENYTVVKADIADMFVQTWYYLYDTVNFKDNLNVIKALVAEIEGLDPALQTVIDSLLNGVFTSGKEESLCAIAAMFAPDAWACPDAVAENGGNGTKGNNGKTPGTGDMSISAIAVASVLFSAGAAIVILRKKKTIAE